MLIRVLYTHFGMFILEPQCSCVSNGSIYTVVSNASIPCSLYKQYTNPNDPLAEANAQCAAGSLFDVASCTCKPEAVVTCPSDCDANDDNKADDDDNNGLPCREGESFYWSSLEC